MAIVARIQNPGHCRPMSVVPATPAEAARQGQLQLNPSQRRVFDDLLAIGQTRPVASLELAGLLRSRIEVGTAEAVARWTEPRFFLSKSLLISALRCPGQVVAERSELAPRALHQATAVGIATHRAVQMANTHPGRTVAWYVDQAVAASRGEEGFSAFWEDAAIGVQSDVKVQSLSRTTCFLDTFPPLDPAWAWRFEETMQSRVGRLTLAARPDLVLGRPRPDGRQTMFICDLKTGYLHEAHDQEAAFYALVSTLRNGVPPFRSTVLSLASGDWTDPDIDEGVLLAAADDVIRSVNLLVDALTETGPVTLIGGIHCRYCPAKATCSASEA